MMEATELKKVVKQLQSARTETEIIDILHVMKKNFQVNEAVLRESKAGLAVGKLRTHANKGVSDLAKEIVKEWKAEVERAKSKAAPVKQLRKSSVLTTPVTPITPTVPSLAKSEDRTAKGDKANIEVTGDKTRDKCVELMYDGLAHDSGAPIDLILSRAKGIEQTILKDNNGVTAAYKAKIRSLFVNLKDKNNPTLRERVVSGDLTVERFCKMTSQEMASDERKAADSKIMEENLHKSLGAEEQGAETEGFQCHRCKQRKCRYTQMQTRSADEPMTTFVTCTVCGNRWKC